MVKISRRSSLRLFPTGVALGMSCLFAGCSKEGGAESGVAGSSAAEPSTSAPDPTPASSPTGGAESPGSTPSEVVSSAPGSPSNITEPVPSGGTAMPVLSTGKELVLTDFFAAPNNAKQGAYNVATLSNQNGIGFNVRFDAAELELRLENRYKKLAFNVGQANDSKASDATVRVEVLKNDRSEGMTDVHFNETAPFDVDVANVNSLKLSFTVLDSNGRAHRDPYDVHIVLYKAVLQ